MQFHLATTTTSWERFGELRRSQTLCDVTLLCGGGGDDGDDRATATLEIPAHRAVLAVASDFFLAMLTVEMAERRTGREIGGGGHRHKNW